MFDKLIEFAISIWDKIVFWQVVSEYEKGVLLRLGKFKKVLEPGLHFKLTVFDEVLKHVVVTTTMTLDAQSLTTKDNESIVVRGVIKYDTSDVKTLLLEVFDPIDAIADMSQATIKEVLTEKTWLECRSKEIDQLITVKARVEARKWGINIQKITLTSIGKIRSIRLITDKTYTINDPLNQAH